MESAINLRDSSPTWRFFANINLFGLHTMKYVIIYRDGKQRLVSERFYLELFFVMRDVFFFLSRIQMDLKISQRLYFYVTHLFNT